tara:strand:- start:27 stop:1313 length:1287 start_codon:yes stop_codon:yes gene_type:complete
MPKQKFLFHVVFNTDESMFIDGFNANERYQLNMLVKQCDLPKYNMSYEEKVQYNKKMYAGTRIAYEPVNITFHDDHADTVNAFWKKYYEYNIADSVNMNNDLTISKTKDDYYLFGDARKTTKFGMDTPRQRSKPYLKGIEIFVLHKKRFTSMTLVNPVIGSFSHDNLDQADGAGVMNNTMQILYETVIYKSGIINKNNVPGFATINYDNSPSPLTILGGGTNSIFGPGGVVDGIGSVIRNVQSGNILGAILSASNTYNNAKKIKKSDVKEELKGIAKDGILAVGKQAGSITNPVAQFSVGAAVLAGTAALATARGTADNSNQSNNTVITNATVNNTTFLGADESFNLVSNNESVRDEIAAALYYRDIGSRKGLTISESNVEYEASSTNIKNVYTSKAITDVRKLVTEGYIKILRQTQDVEIATEKANI